MHAERETEAAGDMTGPDHYRQAEELMGALVGRDRGSVPGEEGIVAEAQVHAILALASATALHEEHGDIRAWREATGQEAR